MGSIFVVLIKTSKPTISKLFLIYKSMRLIQIAFALLCLIIVSSCNDDDGTTPPTVTSQPNILLIIADDMGLDACPSYDIGAVKPNMPNLQNLINSGILFNNLWSYSTCTPTRASILTGKYGIRTNVTKVGDVLSTSETSIQRYLDEKTGASYSHAVIGKWHLGDDITHPNNMGIDYYAGNLSGGIPSYTNWQLIENGVRTNATEYATTKFTNLAIDWLANQTEPWFLWVAYNAAHTPFHLPPDDLHSQGNLPDDEASIEANPLPYYIAMLEAMDTEMGRLINSMSQEEKDNTLIIFIGDNGTPNQVAQEYNSSRAKGSIYKGGINVPMIVSGKDVSRKNEIEDALINTTDLFATIADVAGTGTSEIHDSKSFKNIFTNAEASKRAYIYSENDKDTGNPEYTIRNATHKYMLFENGSEALYNLAQNPMENPNLMHPNQLPLSAENTAILEELRAKVLETRN